MSVRTFTYELEVKLAGNGGESVFSRRIEDSITDCNRHVIQKYFTIQKTDYT